MGLNVLDNLRNGLTNIISKAQQFGAAHPIASAGAAAGVGAGVGTFIGAAVARKKSSRKASKKKNGRRRKKASSRRHRRSHKHRSSPRGKLTRHSHRGTKGIHYTKSGQPYIILASGKARFISKRSAKTRKSRKGGYY